MRQPIDPVIEDQQMNTYWSIYFGDSHVFSQWEMYTEGSCLDLRNEDAWLIDRTHHRTFAVFDGATSLDGFKKDGLTGAYWASHIVRDVFNLHSDSHDLYLCAAIANAKLREAMEKEKVDMSKKECLWSTTITAVDLRDDHFSWLNVGDSALVVIYKSGQYEILSGDNDHDLETRRRLWSNHLMYPRAKAAEMRAMVNEQLVATRRLVNIEYGAINGEAEAMSFVQTGRKNLDDVAHLLLLTDGMFMPNEGMEGIENPDDFRGLVEAFSESNSVQDLACIVRSLERSDPDCHRFLRAKPFDDATGIAISF